MSNLICLHCLSTPPQHFPPPPPRPPPPLPVPPTNTRHRLPQARPRLWITKRNSFKESIHTHTATAPPPPLSLKRFMRRPVLGQQVVAIPHRGRDECFIITSRHTLHHTLKRGVKKERRRTAVACRRHRHPVRRAAPAPVGPALQHVTNVDKDGSFGWWRRGGYQRQQLPHLNSALRASRRHPRPPAAPAPHPSPAA